MYKLLIKTIAVSIGCLFLIETTMPIRDAYALAPASAVDKPALRREAEELELILSGRLDFAQNPDQESELRSANGAHAILKARGKILASKELKRDPLKFIRTIIHLQIESILQIMANEDSARYAELAKIVLSNDNIRQRYYNLFGKDHNSDLQDEELASDIIATAFEFILLKNNRLIEDGEMSPGQKDFLDSAEPLIRRLTPEYFTEIFWGKAAREARIRIAIANKVNFKARAFAIPERDGFIQSERGTAPEELKDIRKNGRDKLTPYKISDIEAMIDRIGKRIALLEKAVEKEKSEGPRERLTQNVRLAKEALERLKRIAESGAIYSFKAIIHGKRDFALGYGNDEEIGLAEEFLGMDQSLLDEYIFHEALCFKAEHFNAKNIQAVMFPENYIRKEGAGLNSKLKDIIRTLIDGRARIKDSVDLLKLMEEKIKPGPNVELIFTDDSDCQREGEFGRKLDFSWEWQLRDMVRDDSTFVFFGAFHALIASSNYRDTGYDNKPRKHFKIALDRERGCLGIFNVPEGLNDVIKEALSDREGPILVEMENFFLIAKLYEAGYAEAAAIVKNYILNNEPLCSFEDFSAIIDKYIVRKAKPSSRKRQKDRDEDVDDYFRDMALSIERNAINRMINIIPINEVRTNLRKYLLKHLDNNKIYVEALRGILGESSGSSRYSERNFLSLLWSIYLDPVNTSDENAFFLKTLLKNIFDEHNAEDVLGKICEILRQKDINATAKALDILLRLKIGRDDSDNLFMLMGAAHYKKEILAAFALIQSIFFGVEEKYLDRSSYSMHDFDPLSHALTPENRCIYYYLLKMEEMRRRGGAMTPDADRRIAVYAVRLDNNAEAPGLRGHTWFSALRDNIHGRPGSRDLDEVKSALEFWLDKDISKQSNRSEGMIAYLKKSFQPQTVERYSAILHSMIARLKNAGKIRSDKSAEMLKEILDVPEEETIEALKDANPGADENDIYKIEYMVRIYYALSERYGLVWSNIIPDIKGGFAGDWIRHMEESPVRQYVEFMKKDYDALMAVIDSNDHRAILPCLANCRTAIRHKLLYEKEAEGREDGGVRKTKLMKLDYDMFLLGKEMVVRALEDIDKCESLDDLKDKIGLLTNIGKFINASGLGGVEFDQLIYELGNNPHLTYSQVHDLTRALRSEIHKIARKISENIHYAMAHMWERDGEFHMVHEMTEEWQARIKTRAVTDKHGYESPLITEEGKREAENYVIDTLIEDTAILSLDRCLMKFNDILESKLTPGKDAPISGRRSRKKINIDDQVFRFGQPEVKPRDKFLSQWSKKGLNLVEMTEAQVPVPPGVILSAKLVTQPKVFKSDKFKEKVLKEIELIRKYSKYPDLKLLLYARSGSAFTLPGLLVTIPNLGMNDKEAEDLAALSGDKWFAYDTYAEFMRSFAIHILGIPETHFQNILNIYEKDSLTGDQMQEVCSKYKGIIALYGRGQVIPEAMIDQVMMAVDCVYDSWDCKEAREYRTRHRISQDWGTVVILQKGVFGNLNPTKDGRISGTGACALRLLPDGREVVQGKFRFRSIGEQLMSRAEHNYILLSNSERVRDGEQTLEDLQPALYKEILDYAHRLKDIFGNNQHFEFTIELNKVWLTQTNDDVVRDYYPEFADSPENKPIARGHGVSGGALRGWVANTIESAEALLKKFNAEKPKDVDGVILFLNRVNPELMNRIPAGVHIVARVISVHAETIAQKAGITAIYGVSDMEFDEAGKSWYIGGRKMIDGETISIDGHENQLLYHNSGSIFLGSLPIAQRSDGRAEAEIDRRSPRSLDRIRDLADQSQMNEAMAHRKISLTPFEREVLGLFDKSLKESVEPGQLQRYLANYRAILDKIAVHCRDVDMNLKGKELKDALEKRLQSWGIAVELFISLARTYHPRTDENREFIRNVISRLNCEPTPEIERMPDIVCLGDKMQNITLKEADIFSGKLPISRFIIINQPRSKIKLVSFEVDDVLEQIMQRHGLSEIERLFKEIKAMGIKVAITTSNPGVEVWARTNPQISKNIDYFRYNFSGAPAWLYIDELSLKPEEIMHFDGMIGTGFLSTESHAARLREMGITSVMVGGFNRTGFGYRAADIMNKRIDVVMPEMSSAEGAIELIRYYSHGPKDQDNAAHEKRIEITTPSDGTKEEKAFTESMIKIEGASKPEFGNEAVKTEERAASYKKEGQSLILYADDILENALVVDIENTIKNILAKHDVLKGGKIIVYARNASYAAILERMIRRASVNIQIVTIMKSELTANIDELAETDTIVRRSRAKGAGDILALIRGPSMQPEELAAFGREREMPIIIVGPGDGVYSFARAIFMAIEAKVNNAPNGWLIMLPAIKAISDDMKTRYEEYRASLKLLVAA